MIGLFALLFHNWSSEKDLTDSLMIVNKKHEPFILKNKHTLKMFSQ